MIQLKNLTLLRGGAPLFREANISLQPQWRVGLIGHNGTGKSSLFSALLGDLAPDTGDLLLPAHWRIAHLAQEVTALEQSALDYVLDGDPHLRQLEAQIASANEDTDPIALANWHESYAQAEGYSAKAKAQSLLAGLGFSGEQQSQAVKAFSGGWRMRLNLAKTLYQPSDLLLLDEPTNHLDLETVLWLQDWLKAYQGTLILISHDRDVLDTVCTHSLHLHQQTLTLYTGNYSSFERQRAERLILQQATNAKLALQKAHLEDFVRRFRAQATKAKQAQSRLKMLERLPDIQIAHADSPFHFSIPCYEKMSSPLVGLQNAVIGHGDKTILSKVNLELLPGSRIGLLGPNGAGKSSLIKSLIGELRLLSGKRVTGEHLRLGYFAQHQLEALDTSASPLLMLQRLSPTIKEQVMRDFLGGFGFIGDEALAICEDFSGGEKARLALALLAWQKPNVLLLDEPTNHLDIDMRSALTLALQAFEGAVLIVSHDRHLLMSSVDDYVLVADGQVRTFDGDLDDYALWMKSRNQVQQALLKAESQPTTTPAPKTTVKPQKVKLSYKEEKELAALPDHIAQLEADQHQLSEQLSDGKILSNKTEVLRIQQRLTELDDLLTQAMERWEILEDKLAQANAG